MTKHKKLVIFVILLLGLNLLCGFLSHKLQIRQQILQKKLGKEKQAQYQCCQLRKNLQSLSIKPLNISKNKIEPTLKTYFEHHLNPNSYWKLKCTCDSNSQILPDPKDEIHVVKCHVSFYSLFTDFESFIKNLQKYSKAIIVREFQINRKEPNNRLFKVTLDCDCLVKMD